MEQANRIRKAESKDLDSIFSFICHLEETSFPLEPFEEIYLENIENPDHIYLAAVNEADEVIGFLSCHGQKLLHHAGTVSARIRKILRAFCFLGPPDFVEKRVVVV